ncbi:hypothetical protein [Streptomyces sp. NPDC048650]|uniref:hypothetical protein n=1 Tax=unclassified Streptomyces TaxID=2593676 RepID=UPI0037132593
MTETRRTAPTAPVYQADAFLRDGRWHLEVSGLESELDTGDTEALLVTLWPATATPDGDAFPASALRDQLLDNGFTIADRDEVDAGWKSTGDQGRYTVRCRRTRRAA